MRTYDEILESVQGSVNLETSLKLTNELLLDIREALMSAKEVKEKKAEIIESKPTPEKEVFVPSPDDVSIYHLPVSTGLRNILQNGKIRYLSDLRHYSQYEVMKFRLMGKVYMKELLTVLKSYGIDMPEFP